MLPKQGKLRSASAPKERARRGDDHLQSRFWKDRDGLPRSWVSPSLSSRFIERSCLTEKGGEGRRGVSAVKVFATKPGVLSLIPGTPIVDGEN